MENIPNSLKEKLVYVDNNSNDTHPDLDTVNSKIYKIGGVMTGAIVASLTPLETEVSDRQRQCEPVRAEAAQSTELLAQSLIFDVVKIESRINDARDRLRIRVLVQNRLDIYLANFSDDRQRGIKVLQSELVRVLERNPLLEMTEGYQVLKV